RTFASAWRLFTRYDIDGFMLEHLKQRDIDTRMVRSKYEAIEAYDEQQIHERIAELSDGGRRGYGLTVGNRKFINIHDLLGVLRRKYDQPDLEYHDVEALVQHIAVSADD